MKKTVTILLGLISFQFFISCSTVPPSYSSRAPEERGERAILSQIRLIGEVDLGIEDLGVFYSKEQFIGGLKENVLFVLKGSGTVFSGFTGSSGINSYQFSNAGSITIDQTKNLILALDDYVNKKTSDFDDKQLYNFELVAGILDTDYSKEIRKFQEITFVINYSITSKSKVFRTVFYGIKGYQYFELKDEQVKGLKKILEDIVSSNHTDGKLKGDA